MRVMQICRFELDRVQFKMAREVGFMILFVLSTIFLTNIQATQSSHCIYGRTVKGLLKLAGISENKLINYVKKLENHGIDETNIGRLTLTQLNEIGIMVLGDRLKVHKFFANDGNDCSTSACKNNGICQDGFRCFSCVCDHNQRYYGPTCELKCPCKNGGYCKATRTGFKCQCTPGYSGDLCQTKYLKEERFLNLERNVADLAEKLTQAKSQLANQEKAIKKLNDNQREWKLHRTNEILHQLEKMALNGQKPTYSQKFPLVLPKTTRAVIISIYCFYGNANGHAYLDFEMHQKGNDKVDGKISNKNRHYNVHANTFYYEQMLPWDSKLPNEIILKVIYSKQDGGPNSWYQARLVGYITA